mmetsp:Transcript_24705/g.37555  ORF Transcript_24705/g.37555 Transcript_24705/m.37555 type:complete len:82 (+) Transcript_24705:40-285(+)
MQVALKLCELAQVRERVRIVQATDVARQRRHHHLADTELTRPSAASSEVRFEAGGHARFTTLLNNNQQRRRQKESHLTLCL